jgi:dTDP-4-dehydrorhamnose 3,5-epimerase
MEIIFKMITTEDLPLKDAKVFRLQKLYDNRGWFTETFRQTWLDDAGITNEFIFDYWSNNIHIGTIRGMHAQTEDQPQAKLVTVLRGSIQDVLIDARVNSPTYGQTCSVIITSEDPTFIYVPQGFYHGFVTLYPETLVGYKLDNYYNKDAECGVMYNDTTLNIEWNVVEGPMISDRDQAHPSWNDAYKFQGIL